jgi:hypothetical protein
MKTTFTNVFEKSFMHGLAGVGKRRTRKQMLQEMTSEASKGVDMAKGLHGKGDWHGAATKLVSSAGLVDQAIDLAETLPGVNFERTRSQTNLVSNRLGSALMSLDTEPLSTRECVKDCCDALVKAIASVQLFADRLNDVDCVLKDGEELDFDENDHLLALAKVMLGSKPAPAPSAEDAERRQRKGEQAGIFKPSSEDVPTSWQPHGGKMRRRNPTTGKVEYKPMSETAVAAERPEEEDDLNK